jgi:hypothetical protein
VKPNLSVAAGYAATVGVVLALTLSNQPDPHPSGGPDAARGVSGQSSSSTSGRASQDAAGTGAAGSSGSTSGTGAANGKVVPPAPVHPTATRKRHPAVAVPVVPETPVAMNDPMPDATPGAVATGRNPDLTTGGGDLTANGPAGVPLSDTFALASRPSSTHTLFLDARGAALTGTAWNAYGGSPYKGRTTLNLAAYTYGDTDPAFDANDLQQLQIAWMEVAADYAAFDVNVTLAPQTDDALGRTSATDDTWGTRVLLTSSPDPAKKAGGIAWLGSALSVSATSPVYWQPALDFSSSGDTGHNIAQTASHEAGHTFGLVHEGSTSEYYRGSTTWAPIMGTSYYSAMGQWSKGEFAGARLNVTDPATRKKAHQDEVGTIRKVLGAAAADNTTDAPTDIDVGDTTSGQITSSADKDTYRYTGTGGVLVHARPDAAITDLDVQLDVVDTSVSSGQVIASGYNPPVTVAAAGGYGTVTGNLDASLYLPETDEPHTYLISVAGGGNRGAPSGDSAAYSSYGSLGSYDLDLTEQAPPAAGAGTTFGLTRVLPLTRTPGVPITFQVDDDLGDLDASDVLWTWASSRSTCLFSNASAAKPTLSCQATDTGTVTVSVTARAGGYPTQTRSTTFALSSTRRAAPHLTLAVAAQDTDTVSVCTGNAAAIRGTVTDEYGRPVYGANVRIFSGTTAKTVKSNLYGMVNTAVATKPAASYGIDTLASGVYPAQTSRIVRTVAPVAPPCFGAGTEVKADQQDVHAIPGIATPLTASVVSDSRPVTGVPVTFTVSYTDAAGKPAVKALGTANTDTRGVATYALKAATNTPAGALRATVAKSTLVAAAVSADIGTLSIVSGATADFDTTSFDINGVTTFTADGSHEDRLILNQAVTVAGRLTAGYGATRITPGGVPVTLAVTYPNPKGGAALVKKYVASTGANGWFRIALTNPPAGTASVSAAATGILPAVPAVPFTDAGGTQAAFTVAKWNASLRPAATTVPPGSLVALTAVLTSPIVNGSARPAPAANLTFNARWVSADGTRAASWTKVVTKSSLANLATGGLGAGTITITPVTSTSYTAVSTTVTLQ